MNRKILWVDDMHSEDTFESSIMSLELKDIDVDAVSNAEEAIKKLKDNFKDYTAVILDGSFSEKDALVKDDLFNKTGIKEVVKYLSVLKVTKGYGLIDFFFYTGKAMSEVVDNKSYFRNSENVFDSELVFFKDPDQLGYEKGKDFDALVAAIKSVSREDLNIKNKYSDFFKVLENLGFADKTDKTFLSLLNLSFSNLNDIDDRIEGAIRSDILEDICHICINKRILPSEFKINGKVQLAESLFFLSGKDRKYLISCSKRKDSLKFRALHTPWGKDEFFALSHMKNFFSSEIHSNGPNGVTNSWYSSGVDRNSSRTVSYLNFITFTLMELIFQLNKFINDFEREEFEIYMRE